MKAQLVQEFERKSRQFNFRLSPNEHKTIHELCKKHNLSTGEFIRRCINDYASKHYSEYCKTRVTV